MLLLLLLVLVLRCSLLSPSHSLCTAAQVGKVAAIVTDTPSTNKKLWRLCEAKYPKMLALPCWMHVLELMLTGVTR